MNVGSEDIFAALGIELNSRSKLEPYVDNCRKIKAFRDANFSFKNYRILDMAAWELSDNPIQRLISQYKESFDTWFPQERYKWRAVQCFQEHWDLKSGDLAGRKSRRGPETVSAVSAGWSDRVHNLPPVFRLRGVYRRNSSSFCRGQRRELRRYLL